MRTQQCSHPGTVEPRSESRHEKQNTNGPRTRTERTKAHRGEKGQKRSKNKTKNAQLADGRVVKAVTVSIAYGLVRTVLKQGDKLVDRKRQEVVQYTSLDPEGAPLLLKCVLETTSAFYTRSKLELRANHRRGASHFTLSSVL